MHTTECNYEKLLVSLKTSRKQHTKKRRRICMHWRLLGRTDGYL